MNFKEAVVTAVCISERKGEQKHPVEEVELKVDWGIVGDLFEILPALTAAVREG